MACQNPVCRECGSSKGLSHDRPSLRAAHAPSNAVTPNQVRVMTELAPGCPVRTFLYCACARVRERHARPCQVQLSRGQKKRPCQSVRANRRHGIPPALPPQPSPALLLSVTLRKKKHDDIAPYFACPHHFYCEQGMLV
ncbi:hypothetical protein V8C44DRAFT_38661 [Trichoderma aethiopicum]